MGLTIDARCSELKMKTSERHFGVFITDFSGADPAFLISGGPNSEFFLSDLRKLFKRVSSYKYKKLCLYKPVYKILFLIKRTLTSSILCFCGFFLKPKLNKSFLCFRFNIYFKINLVLPLGFKIANEENLHLENLKRKFNIFQLINFRNCRIPN